MLLFSLIPFQFGMAVVVLLAARWSKEQVKKRLGFVPQTGRTLGGLKLARLAASQVQALDGVTRTLTCPVVHL